MSKSTSNTEHNVIVAGTIIKGDITTDGDFRVDGTIEGTIASKGRIIVGATGSITGTINANNIDIMGKVEGKVIALDTLSLKSTAKVKGDIQTNILDIEQRAEFNGTCTMGKENEATAAPNAKNQKK
ncbi:MAG: polymer-forming cytoskeletal protein [Paludibacteraceae bacterium]|nr:polymer-forming cytoskeletal protein [Paludibacteraceae bacterium]